MGTILVMVGVEILSNKVKKVLTDQNVRNVEIVSNNKYLSAKSKVFQDADMIIYDQENRNLSFAELQKILDVQVIGRDIPVIQLSKPIDDKKLVEQVLTLLHADFATKQTTEKKPSSAEHQKLHMAFEKQVKELYTSYQDKEICQKDLILICLFIKKWLLEHILVEDKKIGEFSLTK